MKEGNISQAMKQGKISDVVSDIYIRYNCPHCGYGSFSFFSEAGTLKLCKFCCEKYLAPTLEKIAVHPNARSILSHYLQIPRDSKEDSSGKSYSNSVLAHSARPRGGLFLEYFCPSCLKQLFAFMKQAGEIDVCKYCENASEIPSVQNLGEVTFTNFWTRRSPQSSKKYAEMQDIAYSLLRKHCSGEMVISDDLLDIHELTLFLCTPGRRPKKDEIPFNPINTNDHVLRRWSRFTDWYPLARYTVHDLKSREPNDWFVAVTAQGGSTTFGKYWHTHEYCDGIENPVEHLAHETIRMIYDVKAFCDAAKFNKSELLFFIEPWVDLAETVWEKAQYFDWERDAVNAKARMNSRERFEAYARKMESGEYFDAKTSSHDLKKLYRTACLKFHPDRLPNTPNPFDAKRLQAKVNAAYERRDAEELQRLLNHY